MYTRNVEAKEEAKSVSCGTGVFFMKTEALPTKSKPLPFPPMWARSKANKIFFVFYDF